MPNFVQKCAILNELWAIDKIQNGGPRHLKFIIFGHFGQMVYFWWQPSTLLRNFIHLRQSAAELLLFVQKSKMAAVAILAFIFVNYFGIPACLFACMHVWYTSNVIHMCKVRRSPRPCYCFCYCFCAPCICWRGTSHFRFPIVWHGSLLSGGGDRLFTDV